MIRNLRCLTVRQCSTSAGPLFEINWRKWRFRFGSPRLLGDFQRQLRVAGERLLPVERHDFPADERLNSFVVGDAKSQAIEASYGRMSQNAFVTQANFRSLDAELLSFKDDRAAKENEQV